jgi:hypothetical protein
MRMFCKAALTVAAVALLAAPALAQRQGRGGFGFGGGMGQAGPATLLANKSVQEELKLTTDEVAKVSAPGKTLSEKRRSMFADLQGATQEQRTEKMKELTDAAKAADEDALKIAKDTLKPDQMKRFGQIEIQVKGDAAFIDEGVQKTLAITDPEKEQIKTIREEAATKMRELRPAGGQGGQGRGQGNQETLTKIQALRKETVEKVVAVLTDSQKAQWKEMVGSSFEYKPEFGMRGGQ